MIPLAAFIPATSASVFQHHPFRRLAECRRSSTTIPRSRRAPRLQPTHLQANLIPPNDEVDWVIVDVAENGLPSVSAEVIAATEDDAKSAVRAVLRDASAELSVVLTSDEAIRSVNSQWRGVDSATDVLAFPQDDPDQVVLGDVLVSVDTAARQAAEAGLETRDEIRILLLHGLLHLLGYDHVGKIEGDWLVMAQMENRVMNMLGWKGEGLVSAAQDPFYKDIVRS